MDQQLGLFPDEPAQEPMPAVGPATAPGHLRRLSERLPKPLLMGTSSWSFPGWHGIVYDRPASQTTLSRDGLAAYASHPLLRSVGLDRTFYRPIPEEHFRVYADAVPDDFRFIVKADRLLTFPTEPETYGVRAANPRFLDADYARSEVVEPLIRGLGPKAGALLFQFPPMSPNQVGGRHVFHERLREFLCALPSGIPYAVELRTPALMTEAYAEILESTDATHCYTVHPAMSSLERQLEIVPPFCQPLLLVRWMLHSGLRYEVARERYAPFDRLVDEDVAARGRIATTVLDATLAERPAFVIVNNKAEGCAPRSIFRLAEHIVEWGHGPPAVTAE